jgi:hypothetical protein
MAAQQRQAAELLATLKGLRRAPGWKPSPSERPQQTPRAAYEAISATYWSERRPPALDLILDQYWLDREAGLQRKTTS